MKSSENGRISDELLSAYIDNAITEHERNLVEAAVAADAEVAWRLDTLLQTVQLLHALPELALPRSFTIQESFLIHEDPRTAHAAGQGAGASWFGRVARSWRDFWQSGTPIYRNLAAASLVLLLVLVGGDTLFRSGSSSLERITAPAAAPAQEMAAAEAPQAASAPAEPAAVEADVEADVAEDALEMDTTLADRAREETPVEETQSEDTTPKVAAELPAAQDMAAAPQEDVQPTSQPEVAAAAMAAAPAAEAAPLSAESAAAESVAAAPPPGEAPPGEALSLAIPPDEAPPGPPPAALRPTDREGLGGGAAQPQALLFGESDETDFAAAEAFTEAAPPAEPASAVSAEAVPLTSTAAIAAAAVSPLDAPAIAHAPVPAVEADTDVAATQSSDAGALSAQDSESEEQHAPTPPAQEDSPEPANAEGTPAMATLPSAQPLPQSASETQPSGTAETSPFLPLQPISLGLLFATVIFGGLWWRSRGAT